MGVTVMKFGGSSLKDPRSLMERAAWHFTHLAAEAISQRGRFTVALAGGSTPRQLYALLAGKEIDWRSIHFFWGDERCVPPENPESNFRMAYDVLLSRVQVPAGNIHRIPAESPLDEAARRYETALHLFFGVNSPVFDLILLGLGPDGHTASLFPGAPAVRETTRWVAGVVHTTPPPPLLDRITLTPVVLNAARNVLFLVSGADKTEPLRKVLRGPFQPDLLPAQSVAPVDGKILWLVDRAAAQNILPSA